MATKAELLHWLKTAPPIEASLSPCQAIVLAALVRRAIAEDEFPDDVRDIAEKFLAAVNAKLPPSLAAIADRLVVPTKGFPSLTPSSN